MLEIASQRVQISKFRRTFLAMAQHFGTGHGENMLRERRPPTSRNLFIDLSLVNKQTFPLKCRKWHFRGSRFQFFSGRPLPRLATAWASGAHDSPALVALKDVSLTEMSLHWAYACQQNLPLKMQEMVFQRVKISKFSRTYLATVRLFVLSALEIWKWCLGALPSLKLKPCEFLIGCYLT